MKAVGIAPEFDEVTKYSRKWYRKLLRQARKLNVKASLEAEDATRKNFERAVRKHNPDIIIFYNHGNKYGLLEQGGNGYVLDMDNAELTAGRYVYTMACESASGLGRIAYEKGCLAYWGYTKPFGFTVYDEELFMEAANYGLIYKLKTGCSWEEALEAAKEKFDELIRKAEDPWTIIWLSHDRDCLVCYTPNNPPPPERCPFRRAAIKLFGKYGYLPREVYIGILLSLVGYGVALHDFAHQVWELKGTPVSLEGGYIGFGILLAGLILLTYRYVRWYRWIRI